MFIIYNCRTMSLLEVYHICISNSTLYTSYNLYFSANSQRKHQVQTRHFDRKSTQNATSFHLAIETVLLGVLACFSSAFLAVRRLQTDGQSGLVQDIRCRYQHLFRCQNIRNGCGTEALTASIQSCTPCHDMPVKTML